MRAVARLHIQNFNRRCSVDLFEEQADVLVARRGHIFTHVVGADGKLAVATVNEHRKLDGGRTAQIHEGVERGADGATGIEHVVYKHDGL